MKHHAKMILLFTTMLGLCATVPGCSPVRELEEAAYGDVVAPEFLGAAMTGPAGITLEFSETVHVRNDSFFVSPDLGTLSLHDGSETLTVECEKPAVPGAAYTAEAIVEDESGNSLAFVIQVYGYNPDLARVLINEFTTQGSSSHPDITELRVLEGGNLGGLAVYAGSSADYDSVIVLPPVEVRRDDYLLIHWKPEGIAEEVDETEDTGASGGLDASDAARDFWVPDGTGLSGNNGVVSVYTHPGGRLVDAVVYSNRTSDSDERYRGFGSLAALTRVDDVVEDDGWSVAASQAAPEDAVDPEDSTATRSINRGSDGRDTDSAADWHIVPTRGATFGEPNLDEVYSP